MWCRASRRYVASSRYAAPPLRSGPSGDPTYPLDAIGLHGRKRASGHRRPSSENTSLQDVNPYILGIISDSARAACLIAFP